MIPLAKRVIALGDGSERICDFYQAEILWNGEKRRVSVLCLEGTLLPGMILLRGFALNACF